MRMKSFASCWQSQYDAGGGTPASLLLLLVTVVLLLPGGGVIARPTNFQEHSESKAKRFWMGSWVGVETVLAFLGYYHVVYDETTPEENCQSKSGGWDPTAIQVVGVGLGRTGSTSLALALEYLGYTVIHDDEHVQLSDLYEAEGKGGITRDELHEIVGQRGYNATFKTDAQYVADHPEVKGILSVRDSTESYVASWLKAAPFVDYLQQRPFRWMQVAQQTMGSFEAEYKSGITMGQPDKYLDPEVLGQAYDEYNDWVKHNIPSERLLVFNVKQGWEPLCKFLNKPVPEGVPFPHVHDRVKLQGEMFVLWLVTWIWPMGIILPTVLLLCLWRGMKKLLSGF
jgi:hypothetical protein